MKVNDVAFIVNPVARRGKNRGFLAALRAFAAERLPEAQWLPTEGPGHASRLAQEAAGRGCRRLFSVGGDGTLNEVANGVLTLPPEARPAVGTLSSGTGGDFSRNLKELYPYPSDFSWILAARPRRIDVGLARLGPAAETERYFLNIADAGIAGEVVRRVSASRKILGSLEYLRSTLLAAWSYRAPRVRVALTLPDGRLWERELNLLIAMAANSRYFGGGMCIAPEAELDDGLFFCMVAERLPYGALLRQLPQIYRKKRMRHPQIHYQAGTRLAIESLSGEMPIDLDGEHLHSPRIVFEIRPQALDILVPSA